MYAENQSLANIDDLFTFISDNVVAAGGVRTVLNTLATGPTPDTRLGREAMFKINGTVSRPTSFYIFLYRANYFAAQRLGVCVATGIKQATIATWNRTDSTVTVVTTTPHNFVTGDVVFINGTSNAGANNVHPGSSTAPNTITVVDATTFTYAESDQYGTLSATGGEAIAVYGLAGERRAREGSGTWIELIDNTAAKVFGTFDEFGFFILTMQGGERRMLTARQTARNNVLDEEGDVGFTTGSVTGDGTNKVLTLDRACSNIQPGQYVTLISPSDGTTDRIVVYARTDNTHITVPITNGKVFPTGTIIGYDPVPAFCGGSQSNNGSLSSMPLYFTHHLNATRGNPLQQVGYSIVASRPEYGNYLRPGMESRFLWSAIGVESNAGWDRGWIAPRIDNKHLCGPCAVIYNTQTDLDRAGVGAVPADPADYYKIFSTQSCGDNFILMLGPGAAV